MCKIEKNKYKNKEKSHCESRPIATLEITFGWETAKYYDKRLIDGSEDEDDDDDSEQGDYAPLVNILYYKNTGANISFGEEGSSSTHGIWTVLSSLLMGISID